LTSTPLPIDSDLLCGGCGQNLRGVTIDRCPECGRRFDRDRHLSVNVPWERRADLGRLRAFGKTVVAVTFHPLLLIDPTDNPLTLRAARGFRRRAVLALFVPGFVCAVVWRYQALARWGPVGNRLGGVLYNSPDIGTLLMTQWFFYTTAVAILLALFAVTGMASLFFAPRHLPPMQQQRGVAASLYANALLVWLVPLIGFASFGHALADWIEFQYRHGAVAATIFEYATFAVAGIALLAWWLIPCRLLYGVTRSRPRVILFAIVWPTLCAAATFSILIGAHVLVTYFAMLVETWQ